MLIFAITQLRNFHDDIASGQICHLWPWTQPCHSGELHHPTSRLWSSSLFMVVVERLSHRPGSLQSLPVQVGLTQSPNCWCGEHQTNTMSHIVDSCTQTMFEGGLTILHDAEADAVIWLNFVATIQHSWNTTTLWNVNVRKLNTVLRMIHRAYRPSEWLNGTFFRVRPFSRGSSSFKKCIVLNDKSQIIFDWNRSLYGQPLGLYMFVRLLDHPGLPWRCGDR